MIGWVEDVDDCRYCGGTRCIDEGEVVAADNPFIGMDPAWLTVLDDMVDDFWDKDRHGELKGGWGYDEEESKALSEMGSKIKDAAKKAGIFY